MRDTPEFYRIIKQWQYVVMVVTVRLILGKHQRKPVAVTLYKVACESSPHYQKTTFQYSLYPRRKGDEEGHEGKET